MQPGSRTMDGGQSRVQEASGQGLVPLGLVVSWEETAV